jgi:superfamily I DNA/RNA helicase
MTVSTNFRNTKETAAFAEHLNTKGIGGSPGKTPESAPRGNKPEMFQVENDRDFAANFCRRVIADLLDRNQEPDHALLTATENNRIKMFKLVNEEWLKAIDARKLTTEVHGRLAAVVELIQEYVPERLKRPKVGSPGVFIMTMNAAKGCEFESVTLNTKGFNERWSGLDQKKMLYVACTRSRGDLWIGIISTHEEIQLQTPVALRSIPDTVLARSWLMSKAQRGFAEQLIDKQGSPVVNDRVRHKLFGLGLVTKVITGKPITLEIDFDMKGNRTVTAQSVALASHDV